MVLALVSLYAYAMIKPEIDQPTSPFNSLRSLFRVAFRFPVDEDTTYFKESNYYTIKVMKNSGRRDNPLETLVLDRLIHSYSDLEDPLYLEYEYLRAYEEVVRWRARDNEAFRALFIGGGGYTLPRFFDAKYSQAVMDVVEIDPEVTRVSREYFGLSETKRVRSFNQDGRWFVMNCRDKASYDFIFGDTFNDLSVPYHLTTKEFAFLLKGLLKPHGLLLTNLIDNFKEGAFVRSYIRTLEEVFGKGNVNLITFSSDVDDAGISTMVVVASSEKSDLDDFIETIQRETGEERVSTVMPQEKLQQILAERHSVVLTDDYVPVDNLLAPVFEERFGYQR
jgi:spermidine synthase